MDYGKELQSSHANTELQHMEKHIIEDMYMTSNHNAIGHHSCTQKLILTYM